MLYYPYEVNNIDEAAKFWLYYFDREYILPEFTNLRDNLLIAIDEHIDVVCRYEDMEWRTFWAMVGTIAENKNTLAVDDFTWCILSMPRKFFDLEIREDWFIGSIQKHPNEYSRLALTRVMLECRVTEFSRRFTIDGDQRYFVRYLKDISCWADGKENWNGMYILFKEVQFHLRFITNSFMFSLVYNFLKLVGDPQFSNISVIFFGICWLIVFLHDLLFSQHQPLDICIIIMFLILLFLHIALWMHITSKMEGNRTHLYEMDLYPMSIIERVVLQCDSWYTRPKFPQIKYPHLRAIVEFVACDNIPIEALIILDLVVLKFHDLNNRKMILRLLLEIETQGSIFMVISMIKHVREDTNLYNEIMNKLAEVSERNGYVVDYLGRLY